MDKVTHEVRLANWKAVVEKCQSRPKGQAIASWCEENGISQSDYTRQKSRSCKKNSCDGEESGSGQLRWSCRKKPHCLNERNR